MSIKVIKKVAGLSFVTAALLAGYGCSSASKGGSSKPPATTPTKPNTTKPSGSATAKTAKAPSAPPKMASPKLPAPPPKPVSSKPLASTTKGDASNDFLTAFGIDLGVSCADEGLSDGAGACYTDSVGDDYVIACDAGKAWALACQVFEPDASTASHCVDDGTSVGCELVPVAPVADFELTVATSGAEIGPCPSRFEGKGSCVVDASTSYVVMCKAGKSVALDCADFNTADNTYACGTSTGSVACE